MDPLLMILVPGLLGGLAVALLIAGARKGTPSIVVPKRLAAPSPALINMAHIRVEGVGGLGMVGAVVVVAVSDPRIGLATLLASVLGVGLALALIAMRRHTGGLPSSDGGPDGRSMLGLDDERRRTRLTAVRARTSDVERGGVGWEPVGVHGG